MPNWTDKVKQIWNSTKDIDDNIEDLIKKLIYILESIVLQKIFKMQIYFIIFRIFNVTN